MKSKKISFTFAVVRYNLDIEGTIEGEYTPGSPAVMYLRNGDPGYPAEDPEFEVHEVTITDIASQKIAEPIVLDAKGQDQFCAEFGNEILECACEEAAP